MGQLINAIMRPFRWIGHGLMSLVRPKPKRNPESDMYPLW